MSPRRRSKSKRGWPANLYERKGYYSWRHPETREEFGLGRDRVSAFAQAVEANLHLLKLQHNTRLVDRITGDADRSVEAWAKKYAGILDRQNLAPNTRRSYKSLTARMVRMLGPQTPLRAVTTLQVAEGLEAISETEGKPRLAQALRSFMREAFREAKVKGWCAENPVLDTRPASVEVKRARLTLEVFQQLYAETTLGWLRNAMMLALVSGQRREDIANARFADFRDGGWWLTQSKTGMRLFIPQELHLDAVGLSLGDVVSQCRRTGVVSQYLIHQTRPRGNSPRGQRIWIDTLSHRFADAVEALETHWSPKTPPTFHEIRSLSERLYSAQGGVDTQQLLGHTAASTTAMYHNPRGSEFLRVKVTV